MYLTFNEDDLFLLLKGAIGEAIINQILNKPTYGTDNKFYVHELATDVFDSLKERAMPNV